MRVRRSLAVLITSVLCLWLPSAGVHAAVGRHVSIGLWARPDVGPSVVVELLDAASNDVAPACGRGAGTNPDYDGWSCSSDVDLTLQVTASPGVTFEIRCYDATSTLHTSSSGVIALPASWGGTSCLVLATPPASAPPTTPVSLSLQTPSTQAGASLTLLDMGGQDRVSECVVSGIGSTICSPLPYGSYHFGLRDAPALMRTRVYCFVYSTLPGIGGTLQDLDTLVLGPDTLTVNCSALAAAPHIELVGGGSDGFMLVPDAGDPVPCTPTADGSWACEAPSTGGYHIVAGANSGFLPTSCESTYGTSDPIDPAGFQVTAGPEIQWYYCEMLGGSGGGTTLPGGPGDTTDDTAGATSTTAVGGNNPTTVAPRGLPTTGATPMVPWAAIVSVVGGLGLLRLTRRPVR